MPISPSLSRKLRETLGQDAGGDLVTWLDEQREQTARFSAELGALRQELRQEMMGMETRLTARIADTKTDLTAQISNVKSDLMKWSFVFWCGAVAAIATLAGVLRP